MESFEPLIIILLLIIAAETTYLSVKRIGSWQRRRDAIVVDTSALIDGRIVSVARSGFILTTLIIPRSVVAELQYMADNADATKRVRARFGLDVIQELQQLKDIKVEILQDGKTPHGVDVKLVELAKKYRTLLCTVDYNLNKVAQVEGVTVLNINELAQVLRPRYLPGERYFIALTEKGSDSHQGVGHLADGTMVVVENANHLIGQKVEIEFTRMLQTHAGKMMFAKRVEKQLVKSQHQSSPKPQPQSQQQKPQPKPKPKPAKTQRRPKPQPQSQPQRPSKQSKRSPEDSLIDLANKSE